MSQIIDSKFNHGDVVYLKTDTDQKPRIVYCLKVFPNEILYEVTQGTVTSAHYEFELSKEINVLMKTEG